MLYFEWTNLMYNGQNEKEKGKEKQFSGPNIFFETICYVINNKDKEKENGSIIYRNRTHY